MNQPGVLPEFWPSPQTLHAATRLVRHTDWSSGFWLAYVFTASPPQAHILQQRLADALRTKGESQRVLRPQSPEQLEQVLAQVLSEHSAGCVWVEAVRGPATGTEGTRWSEAWLGLVLRANERRELIRETLPGGLVLVAHPGMKADIRKAGPDLWSVRTFVFDLPEGPRGDEDASASVALTGSATDHERGFSQRDLLERDLAELPDALAGRDPEARADMRVQLALRLLAGGRHEASAEMFQAAIADYRAVATDRPHVRSDLAASISGLAAVLALQRRYADAEQTYRQAIAAYEREFATRSHPSIAASLHGLANVLTHQGRYGDAEQAYREVIAILERVHGSRHHPSIVSALSDLANVLKIEGRPAEAERTYDEALSIASDVYGSRRNVPVARLLHGLANVQEALGRYAEAERTYREAIDVFESAHGTRTHADVVASRHGLANALMGQGRYDDAAQIYREAIATLEELLGTRRHVDVAASLFGLGNALMRQGRHDEAERCFREALTTLRMRLGTEHVGVAASLHGLARALMEQERYDDARDALQEAIAIREQIYGTRRHHDIAAALHDLAVVFEAQGELEDAEGSLREALEIECSLMGSRRTPVSIPTLIALVDLIGTKMNRPHDALEFARDAWEGALEARALEYALEAGLRLILMYGLLGREQEAREVAETHKQLLGQLPKEHPLRRSVERMLGLQA